jgi:hypothetical protein
VVRALLATVTATALWLALTRLPFEGALVFATTAAFGLVFGAVTRAWWSGPIAFIGTIAGDLIAVAVGWFAFLSDGWVILPAVAAVSAALASGIARAFAYRPSDRTSPADPRP